VAGLIASEFLSGLVEFTLTVQELAIALLEHVCSLIELLITLEQATLQAREFIPPCARLFLGIALHLQLLVLCLEDEFLLTGTSLSLDAARLGGRRLHRLGCPDAAHEESGYGSADGGNGGHHHDEQGFHIPVPPIRPFVGRTCSKCLGGSVVSVGGRSPRARGSFLGSDRAVAGMRTAAAARGLSIA
jgi:hypothetical protein